MSTLKGTFFIRGYELTEKGDLVINASEAGKTTGVGESVKLKVASNHPARNKLYEDIQQNLNGIANFEIGTEKVEPDPSDPKKSYYQVNTVSGLLSEKDRNMEKATFTKELQANLETWQGQIAVKESIRILSDIDTGFESTKGDEFRDRAFTRFMDTINDPDVQDSIPGLSEMDEETARSFFNQVSSERDSVDNVLRGYEQDDSGNIRQVGYHADYSFSDQIHNRSFASTSEGLHAAANYALQGGLRDQIKDEIGRDQIIQKKTDSLIQEGILEYDHPQRANDARAYLYYSEEVGQVVSGRLLRVASSHLGAKPSNPNIPLVSNEKSPEGEYQHALLETLNEQPSDSAEKIFRAIDNQTSENIENSKNAINTAQGNAMKPGYERNVEIPKDPDKAEKEIALGTHFGEVAIAGIDGEELSGKQVLGMEM